MKNLVRSLVVVSLVMLVTSCLESSTVFKVHSPDSNISVELNVGDSNKVLYSIKYKEEQVIRPSALGFILKDTDRIGSKLKVVSIDTETIDEQWVMPWGEKRKVTNNYNSLKIGLQEKHSPRRLVYIHFKIYNSGIGFRYEFPEQDSIKELLIVEELTEFNLTGDHKTFWIPGDWDIYEHLYRTTPLSKINAVKYRNHESLAQTSIPNNAVNTPVTMITETGLHLSFHEANVTDYAGMTLKVDTANLSMESCLVGSQNTDYKVKRRLPFETPWRTIQIAKNAAGLIESDLIVNLNEPNKLGDVSWFKPMKYIGIWWDMHVGTRSWDYSATYDKETHTPGKPHGRHGATTKYTKELIDFAANHGIGGVLVEGWNVGWENWIGFEDREGVFDFITPYPDYNLQEVVSYGKEKGVELIMHHETSAATETYTTQLDTAFSLMESLGIHTVKTGYVGKILPKGEYHHGQYMVNHYHKVIETAAKYKVAVNAHEPIKATGKRRTYPNIISREGLRGQEFNAWSADGGNPPEHLPIIAFTRMLAGPIDFTPGIFNIKLDPYKESNQVNTTLCQQLALYVVINSPIQMAADLIENYKGHPAFKFIEDVGVNWEQTKVLNGEVGNFVTIAREERNTGNWFVGGITDENARKMTINFEFLPEAKSYKATFYMDADDAHWNENPLAYTIEEMEINAQSEIDVKLAAGGGFAISLKEIE